MSFWQFDGWVDREAVVESRHGRSYTYQQLQDIVEQIGAQLPTGAKTLGIVFCRNQVMALAGYLAALRQRHAVCLLGADLDSRLRQRLIELYQPAWIWQGKEQPWPDDYAAGYVSDDYALGFRCQRPQYEVYPDLAVLLSTSGTTGSPKLVKLSYRNVEANARSIAEYLGLSAAERPVTTLPMQYSYGLSVLNSHLLVGATLLLTDESVVSRPFWDFVKQYQPTSLAGVPYTYQMLWKMRVARMAPVSLRTMTQAGGRLDTALQEAYGRFAQDSGRRFFVMYGQTEATARMSYVPPDRLLAKLGSVGVAIPGGTFSLAEDQELVYQGGNVMLGYAEDRHGLAQGDELGGRLCTGDLARVDEEGFWYITGRKKRFLKIFGLRINLDEVERMLEQRCGQPVYCVGKDDQLVMVAAKPGLQEGIKAVIGEQYHLHHSAFSLVVAAAIPHLANGKVDYSKLQELVGV